MYPNYNMGQNYQNIRYNPNFYRNRGNFRNNDRFISGGFFAPLLLGGLAGYAFGRPNYYPYNNYYNNFNNIFNDFITPVCFCLKFK